MGCEIEVQSETVDRLIAFGKNDKNIIDHDDAIIELLDMCHDFTTEKKLTRGNSLLEAHQNINGYQEKVDANGEPEDNFGYISEFWNIFLKGIGLSYKDGSPVKLKKSDVCEMMALLKAGRQLGQADNSDNAVDRSAYVALAADFRKGGE